MIYIILLGIILILGLFSTKLMKKLSLPNVTGYLITGIVIAFICILIDYLTKNSVFLSLESKLVNLNDIFSDIALGFIALTIGESLHISKIKKTSGKILTITIMQAFLTVILVDISLIIICLLLKLPISIAIILGAIATATAPAATIMVIKQYKAKGPIVNKLIPIVAFDDAIGLVVFTVSVCIGKVLITGSQITFVSIAILPLINIIGSLVLGALVGFLLHLTIKFFKFENSRVIALIAYTLLGVGLCNAINGLTIGNIGFEFSNLLCCMMIGAIYINLANKENIRLVKKDFTLIDKWTPFLFILFFALSGAHLITASKNIILTNSNTLLIALLILIVYLVVRCLGKYFGAYYGCKLTKQEPLTVKYLGVMLFPQAGVAIGMANQISQIQAFSVNNIGNIIVTVVLCATLIYELIGPLLTKWSLQKAGAITF